MSKLNDEIFEMQLRDIWKNVFGDEDEYLDVFFDKIYQKDYVLSIEQDGKVAAMLFMVPYDVIIGKNKYKSIYLYALATVEKYRNKGFMSKLINMANEYVDKNNYLFSFLIPAEEELYGFYKKFGFDIKFEMNNILIKKEIKDYEEYKNVVAEFDKAVVLSKSQFEVWNWTYDMCMKAGDEDEYISDLTVGLIRKGRKAEVEGVGLEDILIGQVLC